MYLLTQVYLQAEAEETMGTTGKRGSDRAVGEFGYTSIFIEKTLGQYLFVGYDIATRRYGF